MARNLGSIYAELRLRLDRLKQDISEAEAQLKQAGSQMESALKPMTTAEEKMKTAGTALSKYVTAPLVGITTAAVYTGMKFDDAMAQVRAISGATGADFERLRNQAKELGRTTRFSASEAAAGMTMLARAGFDVNEIMAAMPGMLDLASAGAVDLATAADIVSDTMMAFGESADQASRYADVFAKAASSANTTVEGLGEAMSYGAASAAAAGMTVEQTAAIMAALADAGIKSTRAGTTFEAMMRDLKQAAEDGTIAIGDTTIAVYDAEGNMRDLASILLDVEAATQGMSDAQRDAALSAIWTTQGLRGVNILLQRGIGSVKDFEKSLINAGGTAKSVSQGMEDNLGGAMRSLRSAIEGAMIEISDVLSPIIRRIAEILTVLVRLFSGLPDPVKKLIVFVGLLVAAIGPLLLIFGTFLTMLPAMSAGFVMLSGGIMAAMVPLLQIVGIIAAVIAVGYLLYRAWVYLRDNGGQIWESIKEMFSGVVTSIGEFFSSLGERIGEVWNTVIEWFAALPGRISEFLGQAGEFISTFFLETLPYWIGYGIGWMVRKVLEGIEAVVEFFRTLPERVSELLQTLVEFVSNKVEQIKQFFVTLPDHIRDGVTRLVELFRLALQTVLQFFMELPGRVTEFLTTTIQRVFEFGQNLKRTLSTAANNAVQSFVNFIQTLPSRIAGIFSNLVSRILNFGSNLASAARTAASRLWSGFKAGLGISSPSYIEEALERIVSESAVMMDELARYTGDMANRISGAMGTFTTEMGRHVGAVDREVGFGANEGLPGQIGEAVYNAFFAAMTAVAQNGEEGNAGVVLQIDGRTFARLILPYLRSERIRMGEA